MNSQQVKTSKEAQLLKLRNIREHLNALLSKKARLELEIRTLEKSYKKKQKEFSDKQKQIRISASLESRLSGPEDETKPELDKELSELDGLIAQEALAIQEMFDEGNKVTINSFISYLNDMKISES